MVLPHLDRPGSGAGQRSDGSLGPISFAWKDLSNCCEFVNIVGLSLALRIGQQSTDTSTGSMAMRALSLKTDYTPNLLLGIGGVADDIFQIRAMCQGSIRNLHEFTRLTTSMR